MRSATRILTAAAVAAGFLFAPFMHVHDAGRAERHMAGEHAGALAFHIHLGHGSGGSVVGSLEESARNLNWFVLEKTPPPTLPAVAMVRAEPTPALANRRFPASAPTPSATESPPSRLFSPRGPPA